MDRVNYTRKLMNEVYSILKEEDADNYSHIGHGIYVKKGDEKNPRANKFKKNGNRFVAVDGDDNGNSSKRLSAPITKSSGNDYSDWGDDGDDDDDGGDDTHDYHHNVFHDVQGEIPNGDEYNADFMDNWAFVSHESQQSRDEEDQIGLGMMRDNDNPGKYSLSFNTSEGDVLDGGDWRSDSSIGNLGEKQYKNLVKSVMSDKHVIKFMQSGTKDDDRALKLIQYIKNKYVSGINESRKNRKRR